MRMPTEAGKKEITRKFYDAMDARDINLLKAIVTDDIVWSLPGKSLMSGEAHGVEAILKRSEILHRYGVKVEIEHVVYGLKDVALHLHNTGKHGDKILDEHLTNVYILRGDKICRIDTFISDVDMLNAFFV
jgi:ketosteroid isomerase-like protein